MVKQKRCEGGLCGTKGGSRRARRSCTDHSSAPHSARAPPHASPGEISTAASAVNGSQVSDMHHYTLYYSSHALATNPVTGAHTTDDVKVYKRTVLERIRLVTLMGFFDEQGNLVAASALPPIVVEGMRPGTGG